MIETFLQEGAEGAKKVRFGLMLSTCRIRLPGPTAASDYRI